MVILGHEDLVEEARLLCPDGVELGNDEGRRDRQASSFEEAFLDVNHEESGLGLAATHHRQCDNCPDLCHCHSDVSDEEG